MSDLVGNLKDQFSHNAAQLMKSLLYEGAEITVSYLFVFFVCVCVLLLFISFILFPLQNCFGFLLMDELLNFLKASFCLSVKSDKISPFFTSASRIMSDRGSVKKVWEPFSPYD